MARALYVAATSECVGCEEQEIVHILGRMFGEAEHEVVVFDIRSGRYQFKTVESLLEAVDEVSPQLIVLHEGFTEKTYRLALESARPGIAVCRLCRSRYRRFGRSTPVIEIWG